MFANCSLIEHLNILYGNSRDFVFFLRKTHDDYEYIYVNKSASEMLGRDFIGECVREAVDPDAAKFIIDNYDSAIDKNEQLEFEDYAYFKYNVHKHETTVTPVEQDGEKYVLAVTKEISFDRDNQDKYLFMRSVFFKTFLSTVLVKVDGTLIEANPTFLNSFDLKIDDVRGTKFTDLPIFADQSNVKMNEIISRTIAHDRFDTQIFTFIDKLNKKHFYLATLSPIYRGEEVTSIFIIFQNVTEYIMQQKQLKLTMQGLETFKRALNHAAEVTITNLKGEIIEVNERFINRTGYAREELLGQTHNILNSNYHPPEFFKNLWTTILEGQIWRGEVRNRTKSGETYWVDTTIIPLTNLEGEVYQFITVHFNVSDKKKMMLELRNIERTFRLITENTNDFIVILNGDGKVKYSSPSYIRKLGYHEDELMDIQYEKLIHPDGLDTWRKLVDVKDDTGKDGSIELKLSTKTGDVIWTEGNYTLVYDSQKYTPSQIIMVSREITQRKQREDSLMFLAYHDSLTQLPNRRYLAKEFPQFIETANTNFESFAVLYIDGDNFKKVNDQFGHDTGDNFLVNFGKVLLKSVRKNDLVVRLGGDEFLIIVGNLSREDQQLEKEIYRILSNIKENLALGWIIGGIEFEPTASIGVAIYPFDGLTLDELLDSADRALYYAKSKSKNCQYIPYFDLN